MPRWERWEQFKHQLFVRRRGRSKGTMSEAAVRSAVTLRNVPKGSPSAASARTGGKKFSTSSDYKQILNRLKVDFEKKYNNPKNSTDTGLQDYDVLKTLGTGAFGVVVSIESSGLLRTVLIMI